MLEKSQTTQTRFFKLVVLYFASGHASFVFAFCCENLLISWMNRHPVSLRDGETCFRVGNHVILRQFSNCFLCDISLCELFTVLFLRFFQWRSV